eukprot:TRINITY_DN8623_c0_g1_i6.p1 TRINITY_DN8623_c0_g1~~TRINITY_DN8623_c0_g1_i6.p1  ORF type:complete len:136 (+),score=3.87 TRINITY_DN8623_c0_g1_i6:65-472(+)
MCRTFGPNLQRGVDPQRIRKMCRTFGPNIIRIEIQLLQRGVDPQRIRKMCRTFGPNIIRREIQYLQRGVDPQRVDPQRIRKMCRTFGANIVVLFNALSDSPTQPIALHSHALVWQPHLLRVRTGGILIRSQYYST